MNAAITTARLSIMRTWREKWGLISWLLIPLLMLFLMSLIGGGGSSKPHGQLLITDYDESMLSGFVIGSISQGPIAEIFSVKRVDEQQGKQLMNQGKASAWLVIEQDFMDNYLNKRTAKLRLQKNPAQQVLPQMVETGLNLAVDAGDYVQILFADELKLLKNMLESGKYLDADLVFLTLAVKKVVKAAEKTISPPLLKLTEKPTAKQPTDNSKSSSSFAKMMFPGSIFMSFIFAAMTMGLAFWSDKKNGVLARLAGTPRGLDSYFLGQLIYAKVMFLAIGLVLLTIGMGYFGVNLSISPILLLWLVFSGVLLWLFILTLCLLMPTQKAANIVVNGAVFPLIMLGGSFFPSEAMPEILAKIGSFLPNGFLLNAMKQFMADGNIAQTLLAPFLIGCAAMVILTLFNRHLLKRLARENR